MALTREIQAESDIAKAKLLKADYISDDNKKLFVSMIDLTTSATNGITPEEKIQSMTEIMHKLVIAQVSVLESFTDSIIKTMDKSNSVQCDHCPAMKHAQDEEAKKQHEELVNKLRIEREIDEQKKAAAGKTGKKQEMLEIIKDILQRPYFWICLTVAIASPYGAPIIDKIISVFVSK